jgi:hypothetical protein
MLSFDDKKKLYILTGLLDVLIINIMIFTKMNTFDKAFSYIILFTHAIFFFSLNCYNKKMLDYLHVVIFAALGISIFLSNIYLLITCCKLLIIIQILWVIENRCILNEKNDKFGFGKELNIFCIILTSILAFKIGYKYQKSLS